MEVEYVVSYNKSSRLHPGLPKSSSHTLWGSLWKDPPFLAFHLRRCLWVQTDTIQRFDRNISRFPWKHSMYGIHGIYIIPIYLVNLYGKCRWYLYHTCEYLGILLFYGCSLFDAAQPGKRRKFLTLRTQHLRCSRNPTRWSDLRAEKKPLLTEKLW